MTDTPGHQQQYPGVEPIAIIGLALRVPGAVDEARFWRNLIDGVESVTSFTRAEQLARGATPAELDDPGWVNRAPFVEGADRFDAGLFDMTSREAEIMNPQHRLFLECAFAALQDAGYDSARYDGAVGVYAGTGGNEYLWRNIMRNRRISGSLHRLVSIATGNSPNYVATTVSYKLNLRGPSLTLHTACSTSLVAVHLACEALRNFECDMALAGGANIEVPPGIGYMGMPGFTSPDGRCRPFDAGANGTVWGSGAGTVLLKRLPDALADGDPIRAVVLGNAINNDGADKVGFGAPSVTGQAAVIQQAVAAAGIDPRTIGYVEAHGTGTAMGDPLEVEALSSVYAGAGGDTGWCGIGSVKSNIGHLSQAAGVVSLIKTVLALEHDLIPPTINYERPNPAIDFAATPFYVANTLTRWNAGPGPRRAGVSSFGIGGTNAHVVLQEAPARAPRAGHARPQLLQVSARTATALDAAVTRLADHLEGTISGGARPDADPAYLADVAATLRIGRPEYPYRGAVVADDVAGAVRALRSPTRRQTGTATPTPKVALLFSGQGAQYAGMGAGLYDAQPRFAAVVDECAALLGPHLGLDIRDLIFDRVPDAADLLVRTRYTQPALFVIEYALARLWQEFGLRPAAGIGHSIGEYVAATLAGVFTLPDALAVVAGRGALMDSVPAGCMLAVQADETAVAPLLPDGITIATVNGPGTCVVAGPCPAVTAFAETLRARKVGTKKLRTSHAFHSAMMDPILAPFARLVGSVPRLAPQRPFLSNVTGTWITNSEAVDPGYWARHLRQPVRFGDCVATLLAEGTWSLVECGPGRQLTGLARMGTARADAAQRAVPPVPSLPGPGDTAGDLATFYAAAAGLWSRGVPVRVDDDHGARRVRLPVYPFERLRYWVEPDPDLGAGGVAGTVVGATAGGGATAAGGGAATATADNAPAGTEGVRPDIADWFAVPAWRQLPAGPSPAAGGAPRRCVLFAAGPRGTALAGALRAGGADVIEVRPGDGFAGTAAGFTVRPGERADHDALVAALLAAARDTGQGVPRRLVHAFALDGRPAGTDLSAAWTALDDGFFSALFLVQALAAAGVTGEATEPVDLDLVASGITDVRGADLVRPEHATLAGLVRVLPAEISGLNVRLIDADPTDASAAAPAAELLRPALERPPEVALRGARRWVLDYEQVRVPAAGVVPDGPGIRAGGRYLVTGGLGGIGITLAEDLAQRYQARLVLVSRSALPDRADWDSYLARLDGAPGDRVGRAIAAIRRMERSGARVLPVAADVTDPTQLHRAREAAIDAFGGLDGIVHAAGLPGGGMAEIRRPADARRVLAPKVAGTLALAEAFGDLPLDFVALCSSVTSVAGGLGQVDYCAGNAFLDAYARGGHGWPGRVLAQNWAGWAELGMAAETPVPPALRALREGGPAENGGPAESGDLEVRPVSHPILTGLRRTGSAAAVYGAVSPGTHWILDEHRIGGVPVVPGTAHLECARAAFAAAVPPPGPGWTVQLRDVVFLEPFRVPDGATAQYRVELTTTGDASFEIRRVLDGRTTTHARGNAAWTADPPPAPLDLSAIADRCPPVDPGAGAPGRGSMLTFGPRWDCLAAHRAGRDEELALLAAPEAALVDLADWALHPALLDTATAFGRGRGSGTYLPLSYGHVVVHSVLPARFYSLLSYRDTATDSVVAADLTLAGEDGTVLVSITDFVLRRVDAGAVGSALTRPAATGTPVGAIRPADGVTAFHRSLAAGLGPQVVIAPYPVAELFGRARREGTGVAGTGPHAAGVPGTGAGNGTGPATGNGTGPATGDGTGPATGNGTGNGTHPAGADLEGTIAALWCDALGVPAVGADDDFFALGGNSLVAVQLIAAMRAAVGVRLPMGSLFETPTVSGLAARVREIRAEEADAVTIPRLPRSPGSQP